MERLPREPSRILLVPRWGGTPESDFYPWLETRVAAGDLDPVRLMITLDMPNPSRPIVEEWVQTVLEELPSNLSSLLLVGHSVGCQTIVRAMERRTAADTRAGEDDTEAATDTAAGANADQNELAGVLLVAPWNHVDEPWGSLMPWLETPFSTNGLKHRARRIHALLSDNDPFTADYEKTTEWLQQSFAASVEVVNGGRHFTAPHEPHVLAALQRLLE